MNKYVKYVLKGFAIFVGLLLVLYLVISVYIATHKKSIIQQITADVAKQINGHITIGDINLNFFKTFPHASVRLHNVTITDSMFEKHHHKFFSGEDIFLELNLIKLIKKEDPINGLQIQNASVYLYRDEAGYTNKYLIEKRADTSQTAKSSSGKNELSSVVLKSVNVVFDDKLKRNFHDFAINDLKIKLDHSDSFLSMNARAAILIHSLSFNVNRGSFVKEKSFEGNMDLRFDKKLHQLQFDSINVNIGKHPFNLSGRFDFQGTDPQFALTIHTKNIDYAFAKKLLTPKIDTALSIVSIDSKIDVNATINGPLRGGDPLIHISWKVEKTHLTTPYIDFDNARFSGDFTNEVVKDSPRADANSRITVHRFTATWNGLPAASENIEINNLDKPILTCDLRSDFQLEELNKILGSNTIALKSGKGNIDITYRGPLQNNNHFNSFINGVIMFSNGTIEYLPRNVEMTNVNGKLILKNSDAIVENLQCVVLNNKVVMNGNASNLLTLMNTEPNKANIDWNIYSPSLNLASFIYLLKSQKKVTVNNHHEKLRSLSKKIDDVLEQGIVNVHLKADKLIYKKFEATNAIANVSLLLDRYLINNVSMQHGGGSLGFNGSLVNRKSDFHEAVIKATLTDVDVNKIFAAFNNFGQNGIESKNLAGKLTANVDATFGLNDEGKVYPTSLAGTVDFSLKNGELINFEPIKKLQSFLFKNRDFENIKFAELKDKFEIRNQEVKINRMEIESSVLSAFVEGVYSMKGNTDISIQVPLSNLKKRDGDYRPKNSGVDKKQGTSIFLRARPGQDGNIQFKVDLFNKFGKEKRKENENVN